MGLTGLVVILCLFCGIMGILHVRSKRIMKHLTRQGGEAIAKTETDTLYQEYLHDERPNTYYDQACIQRKIDIMKESLDIVKTSKNPETIVSRYGVAIKMLEELTQECPREESYPKWLSELYRVRTEIHTTAYTDKIKTILDKADISKTAKTKITHAEKALVEIETAMRDEYTDKGSLSQLKDKIRDYIYQVEHSELTGKAEKLEFKEDYAKAADAYLDVLYFLKKDHISDVLQNDQIKELQEKVEVMRQAAEDKKARQAQARKKRAAQSPEDANTA